MSCVDEFFDSGADTLLQFFRDAGFAETRLVPAPDGARPTMDSWRIAVIGTRP